MKYESFFKFKYGTHNVIMQQIPEKSSVLDVGCAQGYLAEYMSQELKCRVHGVEFEKEAAEIAKKFCVDVKVGDVDSLLAASDKVWNEKFDIILIADVLEHLQNPQVTLLKLAKYLETNGSFVISIPNIVYFQMRLKILFGMFNYADRGILDNTHLRFFTRSSMNKMFSDCGLKIEKQVSIGYLSCLLGKLGFIIDQMLPNLLAVQFVTALKKRK